MVLVGGGGGGGGEARQRFDMCTRQIQILSWQPVTPQGIVLINGPTVLSCSIHKTNSAYIRVSAGLLHNTTISPRSSIELASVVVIV